jgi:5-formyltetrahydrofolate cyclo-ligase
VLSVSLIEQLMQDTRILSANTIGLFHPIKKEPNLLPLMSIFPTKQFYLPKVHGQSMDYVLYRDSYAETSTPLQLSELNIHEPIGTTYLQHPLDVVLIPALAIDANLHRLGFGKGFFDAFLSRLRPKHVIAVIYPFQYVNALPYEDHDQRVDDVLIASSTIARR